MIIGLTFTVTSFYHNYFGVYTVRKYQGNFYVVSGKIKFFHGIVQGKIFQNGQGKLGRKSQEKL